VLNLQDCNILQNIIIFINFIDIKKMQSDLALSTQKLNMNNYDMSELTYISLHRDGDKILNAKDHTLSAVRIDSLRI